MRANTAITAALRADIDRLLAAEPQVRADTPDSVHQMRVATRRLRSVLRSYRRLFRPGPVTRMRAELSWLAGLLGVARDAEVRADRFATAVAAVQSTTPTQFTAALQQQASELLVGNERERYAAAHAQILTALASDRYRTLRTRLTRWRDDPPLTKRAATVAATDYFPTVLRRDRRRLTRKIQAEPAVTDPAERIELLHDIRKTAKRLRYSCEAARAVLGPPAATLGGEAKRVQTVLGEHRDAVEAAAALTERMTTIAPQDGIAALLDVVTRQETAAAERALTQYPAAAAALNADALFSSATA